MADKLKVTFTTINVTNDGERIGKGELYWDLRVDGHLVSSRSIANPYKAGSGEIIDVTESYTVTKQPGDTLRVSGSVGEKDNLNKDDFNTFAQDYTKAANWGIGPHSPIVSDSPLNVTVNYVIERQ